MLAPSALAGIPGKAVGCDLRLTNDGEMTEEVELEVVGPAAEWALVWPARLSLTASGESTVRLTFTLPHSPPSTVDFTVRSTATSSVEANVVAAGCISIDEVRDLRLSVRPLMARARRTTRHTVTVENRGNVAVQPKVVATAPGDAVAVEISPSRVEVEPDEESSIIMRVTAHRRSFARRAKPHRLTVVAAAGTEVTATAETVFFQEPVRWRAPALVVLALLAVLVLWWPRGQGSELDGDHIGTDRVVAPAVPTPALALTTSCPSARAEGDPTVIATFAYCPPAITVAPGSDVMWTNDDTAPHTVTSSDWAAFDSGILEQGQSFRTRFEEPGTYEYLCTLHPGMRGTVVVAG